MLLGRRVFAHNWLSTHSPALCASPVCLCVTHPPTHSLNHSLTHQDDLGVILSSCQRLGVVPGEDWQAILASAFLQTIDTKEKAAQVRTDFFVKPLVGLAGMGWKPDRGEWQVGWGCMQAYVGCVWGVCTWMRCLVMCSCRAIMPCGNVLTHTRRTPAPGSGVLRSVEDQMCARLWLHSGWTHSLVRCVVALQVLIDASEVLLPLGYFRARQLLETAWALAQFGEPVSQHWAEVRGVLSIKPWPCCNLFGASRAQRMPRVSQLLHCLQAPSPTLCGCRCGCCCCCAHRCSTTSCGASPSSWAPLTLVRCCTAWPTSAPSRPGASSSACWTT